MLIYNYININKVYFKDYFDQYEGENQNIYEERYNNYLAAISIYGRFSGDFELLASSIVLNKSIVIYRNTLNDEYEYINMYKIIL